LRSPRKQDGVGGTWQGIYLVNTVGRYRAHIDETQH
jgi:hypothetical protein